jgi:hypothetical protein
VVRGDNSSGKADPYDPLFRLIPSVRLDDVPGSEAVGLVKSRLRAPEPASNKSSDFSDSRHFSIDVPQATMLDLLNVVVRSHGELTWDLSDVPSFRLIPDGYKHTMTFHNFHGTGIGFDFP